MKAAIAIDAWKLPIFERHLTKAGYTYQSIGPITDGTLMLSVTTDNGQALAQVVLAANIEAKKTGKQP